jgi:hypothetical protein
MKRLDELFVWSSFTGRFDDMPEVADDMIVIVTNSERKDITIYDVKGLTDDEINTVVELHCADITSGCCYSYSVRKKVGNCYFCD